MEPQLTLIGAVLYASTPAFKEASMPVMSSALMGSMSEGSVIAGSGLFTKHRDVRDVVGLVTTTKRTET